MSMSMSMSMPGCGWLTVQQIEKHAMWGHEPPHTRAAIVPRMDLFLILLPVAAGAIAGGLLGEWRARAAEWRAEKRSAETEARSRARYFADLERTEYLAQIDQTEMDYVGNDQFLVARLAGSADAMSAAKTGALHYPKAEIYLIADVALLREVMRFRATLGARPFGSGITRDETARMGILRGNVMTVLGVQRGRLLRGGDLTWIPFEELQALQRELMDTLGAKDSTTDAKLR